MRFTDLKKRIAYEIVRDGALYDGDVTDIAVDHRLVKPGTLFFAVRGEHADGHTFITEAIERGALAAVGTAPIHSDKYVQVTDVQEALRAVSPAVYGNPQKDLVFIGVTGTNGKTTTTYLIEQMLAEVGPTGIIGTLGYRWKGTTIPAENTTPFPWVWYRTLAAMRRDGVRYVVAEVSSHALDQNRIAGTRFDVAVFTNFSRDHLDYHGSEENYFGAKKRLFDEYLRETGEAVVNADDAKGRELARWIETRRNVRLFSVTDPAADLWVRRIVQLEVGYDLVLLYHGEELSASLHLPGHFNISNFLAAILAVSPWVEPSRAVLHTTDVVIPGRMERVGSYGKVFVDYAHTPDALEKSLIAARECSAGGRVIAVFGAGGDRDKGKRPLMGTVAARHADIVIVTSDNPRTEDPIAIIADITSGIPHGTNCETIPDRSAAIRRAIELMTPRDVVLIAGKGAEDYQIIGTQKRRFSDREEVLTAIGERG